VLRTGISFVSIDQARYNLEEESRPFDWDFDALVDHNKEVWNDLLSRIEEGKNEDDKRKFYTGLYHALLGRGLASDVNGAYPMNNGEVGQIPLGADGEPKYHHYNTDAIWGGFWNLT